MRGGRLGGAPELAWSRDRLTDLPVEV